MYASNKSQPTKTGCPTNSAKKQFSWVDAVRGKSSASGVSKDMPSPPTQKTFPLSKQSGTHWGQKISSLEPSTEDHPQMKTMSLPSSMAAREKKIVQNSSGNAKMSTSSMVHSRAPTKEMKKNLSNGAGPENPVEKKSSLTPKSRESYGREEWTAKDKITEVTRPIIATKVNDPGCSNFDSVGTQPSKRPAERAESGSDDCFFDKPSTASINKRGNTPIRARTAPKKQEATQVHRTPIAVPLKGGVSHGNPWKTRAVSGSGKVDDSPGQINAVDSTNSPTRDKEETKSSSGVYPILHSDPGLHSADHSVADTSIAGASQKLKKQPLESEQSQAEAQQSEAVAVVDAVLKQTKISDGKTPARLNKFPNGSVNAVQKGAVPPQVVTTRPVTSSKVQPGISWSQKVKESLARDSAKSHVPQQTPASAKKPYPTNTSVPQNCASHKPDEAGDSTTIPGKQGSEDRGKPKALNTYEGDVKPLIELVLSDYYKIKYVTRIIAIISSFNSVTQLFHIYMKAWTGLCTKRLVQCQETRMMLLTGTIQ